ncbi:MAG: ABC transporter permease, partial [Bacteroidales bacterium]|nr:ABC transporter permease [Bacteroidales bacterium]
MIVFKTVLRNSKRNIISILGISLAYVVSLIIIIYVNDQLSIDKSQSNYKKIYRLERGTWALLPGGVIPWVEEQYPEVVSHARIGGTYWESMIDYQNEFHTIERVLFVDGKPFDVFDYNFIYGDAETALDAPNAVVLTNELSRRIFGDENPMGKLLNYNDQFPVQVTAVIEERSDIHLRFDMLIKFEMLKDVLALKTDQFMTRLSGSQNYMGYMVLNTDDPDALVEKINSNLIEIGAYDTDNNPPNYIFRPFKNIYFSNDAVTEFGVVHGNFQTVIAMIFIALFILIIATINYVNVANAKGITRAREVGLRKLLGCSRKSLILQFISESVFISLISFILAILFILILYNPFQTAL